MVTNQELKNMSDDEFYETAKEGLKGLPRSQRRAKERELKENIRLMKSFSPSQLRLIEAVTTERAKLECEEQIERYLTVMDTCISAYMYLKNENLTEDEVLAELKIIDDMVVEHKDKLNKLISENRGSNDMANKQLEKMSEAVRNKCMELIENSMNQSKSLVVLEAQFPTLSKAMLVNAYKKVKKEMKVEPKEEVKVEPEILAAVDYIFPEIKEEIKDPAPVEKAVTEEEPKEIKKPMVKIKSETKKEEEVKVNKESKLKLVSKSIVVEGEFGKYNIDQVGVTVGELQFESLADVEEYKADELEAFEKRIAEIKQVVAGEF
jgi:hypothetical protein